MSETHWKKLTNPNYLGAYAFNPGEEKVVTIEKVCMEQITGSEGRKEDCIVAHLVGEKPLILNKTNCKTISKLLKTPYIEEWAGHRIQIGAEMVSAFGERVEALRVRKTLPKDEHIKCEICGKDIKPAYSMTVAELAKYTKDKYGKTICAECAKKEAENNGTDK